MTIGRLKELIADLPDDGEVRLMTQSNYPFENSIAGIWEPTGDSDFEPAFESRAHQYLPGDVDERCPVFYIVEGRQIGYGTRDAWEGTQQ